MRSSGTGHSSMKVPSFFLLVPVQRSREVPKERGRWRPAWGAQEGSWFPKTLEELASCPEEKEARLLCCLNEGASTWLMERLELIKNRRRREKEGKELSHHMEYTPVWNQLPASVGIPCFEPNFFFFFFSASSSTSSYPSIIFLKWQLKHCWSVFLKFPLASECWQSPQRGKHQTGMMTAVLCPLWLLPFLHYTPSSWAANGFLPVGSLLGSLLFGICPRTAALNCL